MCGKDTEHYDRDAVGRPIPDAMASLQEAADRANDWMKRAERQGYVEVVVFGVVVQIRVPPK